MPIFSRIIAQLFGIVFSVGVIWFMIWLVCELVYIFFTL